MGGIDLDGAFTTLLTKLKEHIAGFDLAVAINNKSLLECEANIKELIKTATARLKAKPGGKEYIAS
jgi:hypothetical protein